MDAIESNRIVPYLFYYTSTIRYNFHQHQQSTMGETISDAIAADHSSFDEYADYLRTATDDAEKVRWRNQLTWTVARHAISEELTLYPAMEKHLGDEGVKLAKTDKEQHQGVSVFIQISTCLHINPHFRSKILSTNCKT